MFITLRRLRRLLTFDLRVLDEVWTDPTATLAALVIAIGSIFALGVGGWLWWITSGLADRWSILLTSAVLGTGFAAAGWVVWLIVAYMILSRLTRVEIDVSALLRCAGFACAPLLIALLMAVRPIAFGIGMTAIAAWVVLTQIALQRASGRAGGEAVIANLAGFGVWAVLMSLLATATNHTAPGPFLAEAVWEAVAGAHVTFLP